MEPKEIIEIVGPNGCGKTSLLKLIAGLVRPTRGTIHLSPLSKKPLYLPLHSGFDEELTAEENLQYLSALERQKTSNIPAILKKMGMISFRDEPLCRLSAGQRQRAHLARLPLLKRFYWLLDEPFTSLDAEGEEIFKRICRDHQRQGGIILIASPKPLNLGKILFLQDYIGSFVGFSNTWESL